MNRSEFIRNGVLPVEILYVAVPWSFTEVYVAACISSKIMKSNPI